MGISVLHSAIGMIKFAYKYVNDNVLEQSLVGSSGLTSCVCRRLDPEGRKNSALYD